MRSNTDIVQGADIFANVHILKRYQDAGLKNREIAQYVGKSETYVSRMLQLAELPDEVKKIIQIKSVTSLELMLVINEQYRKYGQEFLDELNNIDEIRRSKLREISRLLKKRHVSLNPLTETKTTGDATVFDLSKDIATQFSQDADYTNLIISLAQAPHELQVFLMERDLQSIRTLAQCSAFYRQYGEEFLDKLKQVEEFNEKKLNVINTMFGNRISAMMLHTNAKAIKNMADSGLSRRSIAARLNKSVVYVSQMKSFAQTPKELLDFLIQKGINSADVIAKCNVRYRKYGKEFLEELKKTKQIDRKTLNKIDTVLKEQHPTMDPLVIAKTVKDLADSGVSRKDIAARLNKSVSYVFCMKSLNQMPKKLLDFLIQKDINSVREKTKCSVLYQKYGEEFLEELKKTKEIDINTLNKIDAVLKEQHPTVDPFVTAKTIKDLADSGVPNKDIAVRLNKNAAYVSSMISLAQTPQDLKDYFAQKNIRSWCVMVQFQRLYLKYGKEFLEELEKTKKINEASLKRISKTLNNCRITAISEFTKELDHAKEPD